MSQVQGWDESSFNLEFVFCVEMLRLESLHYGYWDLPEKVDLDSIRRAQERYTRTLIDQVPDGVKTVLDVGCGLGDVTRALAQRGFRVTALSPDRGHAALLERLAARMDPGQVRFRKVKFEDFDDPGPFDLVLMSESQDYFDLDAGLAQCRRLLRPGGHLLVSGSFRIGESACFASSSIERTYTERAGSYGLELKRRLDITSHILPTLEFANESFQSYLTPGWKILNRYLGGPTRFKLKVLRRLFAREFRRLSALQKYYEERFDPALYQAHNRYLRLLFQKASL
jgi:SAM-dependent methyltransferase